MKGEGTGDGAIDALLQAINAATGIPGVLKEYHVAAVTADTDALGEVSVLVEHDGRLVSGPERLDGHARGVGARIPARAVERAGGRRRRAAPPVRGGSREPGLSERDFTWIDGERLIRFGVGALAEAPALLGGPRVRGLCAADDERAAARGAPALVEGAAVVLDVPAAASPRLQPRCAREWRAGRWSRSAAAGSSMPPRRSAGADGLPVAAIPTTLSGAEMTPFHRMPAGVERVQARAPVARGRRPRR